MFKRILALNANHHHFIILRLGQWPIIFEKRSTLAKMLQHFIYVFMSRSCHVNPKVTLSYLRFAMSKNIAYYNEISLGIGVKAFFGNHVLFFLDGWFAPFDAVVWKLFHDLGIQLILGNPSLCGMTWKVLWKTCNRSNYVKWINLSR